jgi:NhaP-type Na+/H+ or K+/H+ antiporter
MPQTIFLLGTILFLAYVFLAVFERTRVPDVLLLILVGIVLGPHVLGLASPADFGRVGPVVSTVALIVVLLLGGVELDLSALGRALRPTLYLALSSFVVTVALVTAAGRVWLDLGWLAALMLGTILGGTSSAVVIPLLRGLALPDYPSTILTLESALTDVLTVVLAGSLMQAAAATGAGVDAGHLLGSVLSSMVMACGVGIAGGILWLAVLPIGRRSEDAVIATIAFAFLVYGLAEALRFNGGIAVLAFGLTLSNHTRMGIGKVGALSGMTFGHLGSREKAANRQAQFLLKVFFFVYLGISVPFRNAWMPALACLLVVVVYAARHALVRFSLDPARVTWDQAAAVCALAPKGLAAAVLASQPKALGIRGGEAIADFTFTVVLVSISMTALLIPLTRVAAVASAYRRLFGGTSAPAPQAIS